MARNVFGSIDKPYVRKEDRPKGKGNPNWVKGLGQKPKGSVSKANSNTRRILKKLNKHPVEELVNLAEFAKEKGDYKTAIDIWRQIHEENKEFGFGGPEVGSVEDEEAKILKDLENAANTGSGSQSKKTGMDKGETTVPPETRTEGDLLRDLEKLGTDIRCELLPTVGQNIHNVAPVGGNGNTDA